PCTLDAVGIQIGQVLGLAELTAMAQQAAQEEDRPERIGGVRPDPAAAVVLILAEDGLGFLELTELPEQRAEALGRVEGDWVVGAEDAAAPLQISAEPRLGLRPPARLGRR